MVPTEIVRHLESSRVPFAVRHHPRAVTAQELAASVHVSGYRVAKSVLVDADGAAVMAVLPAADIVDTDRLAVALGVKGVRLMREFEFAGLFGDCENRGRAPARLALWHPGGGGPQPGPIDAAHLPGRVPRGGARDSLRGLRATRASAAGGLCPGPPVASRARGGALELIGLAGRTGRAGLLVGLALGIAGCTHLPWRPYSGWQAWRSDNLVLYSDTLFEQQQAFDWLVSSAEILQRTFFNHVRVPPAEVVYLHPGNSSHFTSADGEVKFGVVVARLPLQAPAPARGLVLVGRWSYPWPYAHLLAHHYIETAVPRAPLWFHEGFAQYLGTFTVLPERPGVVCFGHVESGVQWQVTVSLKELLAASWADYNRSSAPWIAPSAWGLIDFLFHGDEGRWRSRHHALMRALAEGRNGEQALLGAFPELTLAELDARVREHVRTRKPRSLCPLPVRVGAAGTAAAATIKGPVEEKQIRAYFEALDQLPEKKGYSDFIPVGLAASPAP